MLPKVLIVWLALLLAPASGQGTPVRPWTVDFRLPREVSELSGMVVLNNVLWCLNDSGNEPRLLALGLDGTLLGNALVLNASNVDWEGLAFDRGRFYVADLGNNDNARTDLAVYEVPLPEARGASELLARQRIPVVYPEQGAAPEFDCEALFVSDGQVYCLTKERRLFLGRGLPGTATRLYRLDTRFADRPNRLTLVQRRTGLGGWVTAADMCPDGKTLAILCHMPVPSVWLFEKPLRGDELLTGPARRLILSNAGQCETLAWESPDTLLVGNEAGEICRLRRSEFGSAGSGR